MVYLHSWSQAHHHLMICTLFCITYTGIDMHTALSSYKNATKNLKIPVVLLKWNCIKFVNVYILLYYLCNNVYCYPERWGGVGAGLYFDMEYCCWRWNLTSVVTLLTDYIITFYHVLTPNTCTRDNASTVWIGHI